MKLRTEIENITSRHPIGCQDSIFVSGSCFAENIGSWLSQSCLDVCLNPFGVLFNPASIATSLLYIINNKRYTTEDVVQGPDGMYYSFAHHGRFSATTAAGLVGVLNENQNIAARALFEARHLLITFGTAWVFERQGEVVANCHKFPGKEFVRRRLSVEEIVSMWKPLIETLIGTNSDKVIGEKKHIIFTVSPIRHLKDGLHGNQLSKATLLLAIDELCRLFPDDVEYLPIYELLIDDLRDYRFYADDMTHPSSVAIDLVKEYFAECCLDDECKAFLKDVEPLVKAAQHRPLHPESDAYREFLCQNNLKIEQLQKKYSIFGLSKLNHV